MKITKLKGKGNLLQLEVKDAPDWYLNTVRRLLTSEVPVMAIEVVEIVRNDSVLYDEIVTHRLGLVPLTTDIESYSLPTKEERDSQEYLAQSSCKLTLEAKGPCVVYAKDLSPSDPKVKPAYPDMPITKLTEGQELRLVATAVLGTGRDHAKWSAGHAYFRKIPDITVKNAGTLACAQACPTGTLVEKNGKVEVTDEKTCILCMACVDIDGGKSVQIDTTGNDHLLHVESWGQVPPAKMVESAIDVYTKQLKEFDGLLSSLE